MPPQPGMFSVPHSSTHKSINQNRAEYADGYHQGPGSSYAAGTSRSHVESDARKEKKRKEFAGRLGKEMIDRRDDLQIHDRMKALHSASLQLSARPESSPLYNLRLYPLSLERSAMLVQSAGEERRGLNCADIAYEEEKMRIEDEYLAGRARVKERLLEGLEERRKKAREEKEGEGTSGDGSLDSTSRPHITRKLRNKIGASPPPASGPTFPAAAKPNGTTDTHPPLFNTSLLNPNTLLVDEIPSPFPLPLVSSTPQTYDPLRYTVVFTDPYYAEKEERKPKNWKGVVVNKNLHGLGPALKIFNGPDGGAGDKALYRSIAREHEVEEDLFKLRRGTKRKRGAANTAQ